MGAPLKVKYPAGGEEEVPAARVLRAPATTRGLHYQPGQLVLVDYKGVFLPGKVLPPGRQVRLPSASRARAPRATRSSPPPAHPPPLSRPLIQRLTLHADALPTPYRTGSGSDRPYGSEQAQPAVRAQPLIQYFTSARCVPEDST